MRMDGLDCTAVRLVSRNADSKAIESGRSLFALEKYVNSFRAARLPQTAPFMTV